jgi:LacI family transcriptional regulator
MLELMWPYRRHLEVFAGTQRYARDVGGWVCEVDEYHADRPRVRSPLAGYDGILGRAGPELAQRAARAKAPLVNVWFGSPVRKALPGVFPDFAAIGAEAAAHLLDRGFRQFGCLSSPGNPAHAIMVGAFHDAVCRLGCRCLCAKAPRTYYRNGASWSRFQRKLDAWIAAWTPPVALFIAFDDVTIRYVVNACRRHGLRVPEDVALISGANEPMIGEMPAPSLSSVEVNYEQIGYQAAQMLDQLMRKSPPPQKHAFLPPNGVIARDSTDFFAVDDKVVARAMRYIERNTGAEIDVDSIAQAADVSRRTLQRRFRNSAGRSIAQELRRIRLMKAKRLLAQTDLLVKQIARETGFRDPIRLYEALVREEGITPSDYRRIARGEQ